MTTPPLTPAILPPAGTGAPDWLLPWEDPKAFDQLRQALLAEHRPSGPTERHLTEQLAILLWRKGRVLEAERALHLAVLQERLERDPAWGDGRLAARALLAGPAPPLHLSAAEAVSSTPPAEAAELETVAAAEAVLEQARAILARGGRGAYQRALAILDEATRERWQEALADDAAEPDGDAASSEMAWRPNAASLRHFLAGEIAGACRRTRAQLEHNPALRRQAFAESLDPDRAAQLQAYDVRLDRQIERTLAMLLKLQEIRGG